MEARLWKLERKMSRDRMNSEESGRELSENNGGKVVEHDAHVWMMEIFLSKKTH